MGGEPRENSSGGSRFGTAASCICRVAAEIHLRSSTCQVGEQFPIEQQSSSSRCDSSRCSVRKSSARHVYPQNARTVLPQMPSEPIWMVRTMNISEQHQHQQQIKI